MKQRSHREYDTSSNKGSLEKRDRLRLSSQISSSVLALPSLFSRTRCLSKNFHLKLFIYLLERQWK